MIYDDLPVRNGDCPKTIFGMIYVYPPVTWQFFKSPSSSMIFHQALSAMIIDGSTVL